MKITGITDLWTSRWFAMKEASYLDKNSHEQHWQYVERVGRPKVVTIVCFSNDGNLLLIRQARVPLGTNEISFPAGLTDIGESLEQAALRELMGETGYRAKVLSVGAQNPKSAGLTNETASPVLCSASKNDREVPEMEETEEIESFWVDPLTYLNNFRKLTSGDVMAHDVYCLLAGYSIASKRKKLTARKKKISK